MAVYLCPFSMHDKAAEGSLCNFLVDPVQVLGSSNFYEMDFTIQGVP